MSTAQHKIGSGFGATSTADDVLRGIDLTGKLAIVTGGYSGLGLETTRALTKAGARVVVPARRRAAAEEALSGLTGVEVDELDLGDLESVRGFAERFLASGRTVDIVIDNAGIMACPETRVGPGWEAQFATNHLGHFALVNRLWPAIEPGGARVVSVSSRGHHLSGIRWDDVHWRHGYDKWEGVRAGEDRERPVRRPPRQARRRPRGTGLLAPPGRHPHPAAAPPRQGGDGGARLDRRAGQHAPPRGLQDP